MKEYSFCKCGCGNRVKNKKSIWCRGHSSKSPEERTKISERMKGENNPNWEGKSCYEETRKKLSIIGTGKERSEEFCRNQSERMKGKNNPNWRGKSVTEETRQKHSKNSKGESNGYWRGGGYHNCVICNEPIWKTPKSKRKLCHNTKCRSIHISVILSGPNGPNWKGGISLDGYCINWDEILKDYIKERDGYKCMNPDCWHKSKILNVHHINYIKKECDPKNLITLCASCNARANFKRDYWQQLYQTIIGKIYGL